MSDSNYQTFRLIAHSNNNACVHTRYTEHLPTGERIYSATDISYDADKPPIVRIDTSKHDIEEIQQGEILICDCGNKDNHIGDDRFIDAVMLHYDGEYEIDDTGYDGFDNPDINKQWQAWLRTGDGDDFEEVEKDWHFSDFTIEPCDQSEGEDYYDQ
jgi:hypothetical protein